MPSEKPLNWRDEDERRQWIICNADYFTITRRIEYHNHRVEVPTLAEAMALAQQVVRADPAARLLIYAIHGSSDTYVCTVDHRTTHGTKHKPIDTLGDAGSAA
jgi:hypothetical protein